MNSIDTPPILIVLAAILSAAGLCVLIAGVLLACNKIGSGDLPGDELAIPRDREFSEVGPVAPRGPLRNVGSSDPLAPSAQEPPEALECGTSVPLSLSPENIQCRVCGDYFDPADLDAVIFHETHTHAPDIQYSGSRRIA